MKSNPALSCLPASQPHRLSPSLLALVLLAASLYAVRAQVWISLQEGDVRVGDSSATVNTAGTLLTSDYATHCTYIRGYTSKNANFNGDTNLLMGTADFGTSGDLDALRLLAGFDLTPVANYIGNYAYKLDAANVIITHRTTGASASSTMALYTSTAFNETNATWNNPGAGAPAGGTFTTQVGSKAISGGFAAYPSNQVWTSAGLVTAVQTALANPTNKGAYLMFKRATENDLTYFGRYVTDENTDPTYGGIDSRPELQVRVTILSNAPLVSVSVTDPDLSEPGNDSATFTITRSINITNDLDVTFTFSGSAQFGADYTYAGPGTVTLPAGVTSTNIVITALDDTTPEDYETVTLNIASSPNYGIGVGSVSTSISDDNDGGSLAQYFFGNTLAPQVWNTNITASVAAVPGLSFSFGGVNLSPPAAFFALNSLTAASEAGAVSGNDYIGTTVSSAFGYETTFTNLEVSTIYYNSQTLEAQQAVLFIRSSLDNFTTNIAAITNAALNLGGGWQTLSVPLGPEFSKLGQGEFRFYIYDDASSGDASMRVDNLYIRGEVSPLSPGKQQVAVVASAPDAAEPSTPGAFTLTRAGDSSNPLEVAYTLSGTASNGVDYATLSGVVTIPAGTNSTVVTVATIDDQLAEASETVILRIAPAAAYSVFGSGQATVTISDNAEPNQFTVVATDNVAYERVPALSAWFTILRAGDTNADSVVNFSLEGTAVSGLDYLSSATNTVTFLAGELAKTVAIVPIDNAALDGTRSVQMTLLAGAGYVLPSVTQATVAIFDDEPAPATVLFSDNFESIDSATNYTVLEGGSQSEADSSVEYAFDYSSLGVPPAPGAVTTKGLKLTVNKTGVNRTAAVNLFPNLVLTNNFAVRFNLYIQWNRTNDFAEGATVGINHSGTVTNWVNYSTPTFLEGDGQFLYLANNDRDTPAIIALYGYNGTNTVPTMLTNYYRASLASVFNNPPYGNVLSAMGGALACEVYSSTKTWVDCELSQVDGVIRFVVNGVPVLVMPNTSAFTTGKAMLGYLDAYDSTGPDSNFALFDNVRIVKLDSVPATRPNITSIAVSGGGVTIQFTGEASDVATGFRLQSSATAEAGYADDNAASITGSGGAFQAVTTVNGAMRFYRIRRN